jgi:hypothetical protein
MINVSRVQEDGYPMFADLPPLGETGERHAWDVWGRDDQLGSLNWLRPEKVRAACQLVRTGEVIGLGCSLNQPDPGPFTHRSPYRHVVDRGRQGRDDRIDGLYLQYGSQWDGLRHIRFREYGYWGGRQEEDLDSTDDLGIDHWARRGLIGRGVLLDMVQHTADRGGALMPTSRQAFSPDFLDEVADAEGVEFQGGDILLIRTGWMEWYLDLAPEARGAMQGRVGARDEPLASPGLDARQNTAAWLWDHRIAAVSSDNLALEVLPVRREEGFLHFRIIPLLGMPVGEMWILGELAAACKKSGRYDFLLASGVLNVPNGVGSPANAYAVL